MIRITGGMTGDTAGAMTEVMELAVMLGLIGFWGLS
jgi:cobalamin synthase